MILMVSPHRTAVELEPVWSGTLETARAKAEQRQPAETVRPVRRSHDVLLALMRQEPGRIWTIQALLDVAPFDRSTVSDAVRHMIRAGTLTCDEPYSSHPGVKRTLRFWA